MNKLKHRIKRLFKWNRFVGVYQFRDVDRGEHIIVMTRDAVYEYDPTGKAKQLFTLEEAEATEVAAPKRKIG